MNLIKNELKILFNGSFSLKRIILPSQLEMTGTAIFTKISDDYIFYEEKGSYLIKNKSYDFFQERYFQFIEDQLHILNNCQKTLHIINLLELEKKSHLHQCKDDNYYLNISYSKESLIMAYSVQGPHKNYEIRTSLIKDNI